ncbi:hypothetical protein LCGC14_0800320 [marine sediment metagenome]|uniref:Uncharacterized protein n=1 Tax=marine sediment metagenome TaxID=412755 RepID=A0A0F9SX11_9ZZZZ
MGQKVQDIIIEEFLGVDSESDPTNLPPGISPGASIRNMYPSLNKTQIRKRPGISGNLTNVARSGPIYHMARGALVLSGAVAGPEVLFMIYGGGAGAVNAATYDIDNDTLVNLGATAYTSDARYMASLLLASRNCALISAPVFVPNWSFIEAFSSTTPFYRLATYAAPIFSELPFPISAWQRQHHWVGDGFGANAARLHFSNFDAPRIFAAANFVDVEPRGYRDAARGFFRMGDALYVGKTDRTYVLTGANDETFVLEQTRVPFGFGGMRGWAALSGGRGIGFVHRPQDTAVAIGREASQVENIGFIEGLDGVTVGDRVISLLRTTSTGGPTNEAFAESTARTIDWPFLLGTLFMPQNFLGFDSPQPDIPMLFRNKEDGSYWPWTIDDDIEPIAFETSDNDIFIGCGDGHIRKFDVSLAQDGGVNFPEGTFYQTPPLWQGRPHVKWSVSYIRIYGSQTSGGVASVQIANDFGALNTAQTFALSAGGAELRFKGAPGGTEAYFQEIRITLADNSVEGTITKIVIGAIATGKSA